GGIPSRCRLRTVAKLRSVIVEIECEHGEVTILLDLRFDHLHTLDFYLACERRDVLFQRGLAVDAFVDRWIEVGLVRRHDFEVALRIAFSPAIERSLFHGDDCRGCVALRALPAAAE